MEPPRHYVNSPAHGREQRENCLSGQSKTFKLVGIGFGLLFIVHVTVTVSLRLQAARCSNRSDNVSTCNSTMSADDVRVLILDRDRLVEENDRLVKDKHKLTEDKDQLVEERDQVLRDKDRLVQDKVRLERDRKQLFREKYELKMEKTKLEAETSQLITANQELKDRISQQQYQIQELHARIRYEQHVPCCPPGWKQYMYTCYKLSSIAHNWEHANKDCERENAHLVISSDAVEETVIRSFGKPLKLWMGLRQRHNPPWYFRTCTEACDWNLWNCAYIDTDPSCSRTWFQVSCNEHHYWMCEKELRPGFHQ